MTISWQVIAKQNNLRNFFLYKAVDVCLTIFDSFFLLPYTMNHIISTLSSMVKTFFFGQID
jgi:hypothetical protein